jgi:hypothetical protein
VTPLQQLRLGFEIWLRFIPGVLMIAIIFWGVPFVRNSWPVMAAALFIVCFLGIFWFSRRMWRWIHDVQNRVMNRLPLFSSAPIVAERVVFIQGSTNVRVIQNSDSFNETRSRQARF